ncbi:MAG: helix-turn-helix transcriptional regulator [Burkholderiaceae bacterium]|nr:helix-turn-helix transcriptional regulator [Burkholderiaceae bacterium]
MTTPRVGDPVRGSRTGRPIMVALDLLGRRAALRVLWELRGDDPLTFRALQDAAATNPALLNTRLKELREARLVEHGAGGYRLTAEGRALLEAMRPLSEWAESWAGARRTARRESKR